MYRVVMFFLNIVVRICFRVKIIRNSDVITEQGIVVCANHKSNWDPILVAMAVPYELHFMAKEELFRNKIANWFFRGVNVFPVKRGGNDLHAIKQALSVVKNKKALALFPEGTRNKDGQDMDAKAGVTMIAIKGGGAILPVAIKGEMKFFHPVTIVVGEPIVYDKKEMGKLDHEDYRRLAKEVMGKIKELGK